jgi:6-phosphogluconolactonase
MPGDIKIFKDETELFNAAASFLIKTAADAIAARGRFTISLSGGHTPEKLYALLAQDTYSKQIDWSKTFVFWGDERCVASDDPLNNARMAKSLLLDKVAIPQENIYPTPVDLSPADGAVKYEQQIKTFFGNEAPRFDLILLGMGDNAHTASLFPGTDILKETSRLVKEVYVEEQKMFRITMTAPLINLAYNIVFLLTGKAKTATLRTVLNVPYQPDKYPVQLIKPTEGKLYWFIDSEAASLL